MTIPVDTFVLCSNRICDHPSRCLYIWINYVEWMAKFVNIPVHTCLESMTSRSYMIKNFSTGILVVLVMVVVLVVLELPPLSAPLSPASTPPSPASVGLSNLVHMKLKLYITYTTVFQCYNCINNVNRCIPVYKRSL